MKEQNFHKPVMLKEVIENLMPKDGEIYLDATFGAGGYSRAILEAANCKVVALDRDISVKRFAENLEESFGERFVFKHTKFSRCQEVLNSIGVEKVDGMVLDIGVSSMQLDEKERGFSFDSESKLDMRMDSMQSISAFEVVNSETEEELAKIIKEYGDEPKARIIAKRIIAKRAKQEIKTCRDLADIVRSLYPGFHRIDPATKTFQALRIYVNQELEELKIILNSSVNMLRKDGRLIVVSFHSLEDRIVKNFLKKESGEDVHISRYQPEIPNQQKVKNFQIVTKSALIPSSAEIENNPRARSAKMRLATKF